ncbi:uncharacterized protein LOC113360346 [Papaver somniferum]|uniref:uncharacterized protein LOC113360346 n=1 Tax=Papaver somniferum TaxID=3469 RepID=UPI000E6F931E|nr:uncharacterized protein LOC113360346 [Papaver somniferum]
MITSISMQLVNFEVDKEAWDFLSKMYTQINFAQRYKLEQDIRSLKQQSDQTISDFHSEMSIVWNQLELMEPKWTADTKIWQKYREDSRLVQLLMALIDEFETVRASILHRSPLPTVETALSELITEETRKRVRTCTVSPSTSSANASQVSTSQTAPPSTPQCNYCKAFAHLVGNCTSPSSRNMRERRRLNGNVPAHLSAALANFSYSLEKPQDAAGQSISPNLAEIQEMLKQALSIGNNSTTASAFSVPTDGTEISATHIGQIKLSDKDPMTKMLVGIGRRVGRLYILESLVIPQQSKNKLVAASASTLPSTVSPFISWHSKLGHVSFSRLSYMINKGLLGNIPVDKEPHCISCKMRKQHALPFNKSITFSNPPFDLIHSDVWETPEQNGVAERKHRHIIETARTQLLSYYVPSNFWGESVLTAVYTINRIPTVVIEDRERNKLGKKNTMCVFLGYGIEQKGYRCYDPETRRLRISRHVTFLDKIPFWSLPSSKTSTLESFTYLDPFDDTSLENSLHITDILVPTSSESIAVTEGEVDTDNSMEHSDNAS